MPTKLRNRIGTWMEKHVPTQSMEDTFKLHVQWKTHSKWEESLRFSFEFFFSFVFAMANLLIHISGNVQTKSTTVWLQMFFSFSFLEREWRRFHCNVLQFSMTFDPLYEFILHRADGEPQIPDYSWSWHKNFVYVQKFNFNSKWAKGLIVECLQTENSKNWWFKKDVSFHMKSAGWTFSLMAKCSIYNYTCFFFLDAIDCR